MKTSSIPSYVIPDTDIEFIDYLEMYDYCIANKIDTNLITKKYYSK